MKNVISGIVLSACVPRQAIKKFLEFEEAQSKIRKLSEEKMTDKIKVWKCDAAGCEARKEKCNAFYSEHEPNQCFYGPYKMDFTQIFKRAHPATPPTRRIKIIWSEVTAENVHIAAELKNWDSVIDSKTTAIGHGGKRVINISDIPPTWLEDVPAAPVSAATVLENAVRDGLQKEIDDWPGDKIKRCFFLGVVDGSENERLRHLPTMNLDGWWLSGGCRNVKEEHMVFTHDLLKQCWQACLNAHNLPLADTTQPRHAETTTYEDWSNHMYPDWTIAQVAYGRIVWNACVAAHNQPEPKP